MYPHSFFADPDTAVFLNADPDPGSSCFLKNEDPGPAVPAPCEEFSSVKKDKKDRSKVKRTWSWPKVFIKKNNYYQFPCIFPVFYPHLFPLLDPDPDLHIECGSGFIRENKC